MANRGFRPKRLVSMRYGVVAAIATTVFVGSVATVVLAQTSTVSTSVQVSVCGNNVAEGGEGCDNEDLDGASCSSLGYDGGTLSCTTACEYDESQCTGTKGDSSDGGGGGGGGSGGSSATETAVEFSGLTAPGVDVAVVQGSTVLATSTADTDGHYKLRITDVAAGVQTFGLWVRGPLGQRSLTTSLSVDVTKETTTLISDTVLPPTIKLTMLADRRGAPVLLQGSSPARADIKIFTDGPTQLTRHVMANDAGTWSYTMPTTELLAGRYVVQARAEHDGARSVRSAPASFLVRSDKISIEPLPDGIERADLNDDNRVNLVDVSIIAYWDGKENAPEEVDMTGDGRITLRDYSILAYYWTG